ncbi:LemA family protein [Aquimarina sp. MMG016]|uniref:LemA family protein n=1 Tax=Aquimarina sp. MMG016 TaxID=2822690 RepID=UPI001B3A1404|nr:LemA family protein [Aquimarina sp. MMG016]MBQ4821271.1 LemA family protein [Aquimarina sp. MMG016]
MEKLIGIIIIVLVVVGFFSVLIRIYNKLVMLKFNIDKAFANIDILLKQRAEEIPNLISTVKEYMSFEKETLNELTKLRTNYLNTTDQEKKVKAYNELSKGISRIMVLSENYPDLKANNSFINLQERVSQIEDHISDRRELFNESVNMYNIGIHEFPNIIISKLLGYKNRSLLAISEEEKKYDGVQF